VVKSLLKKKMMMRRGKIAVMSVKRKQLCAEFKAKVALEALIGRKTTNEIASEYQIHPNLVTKWKSQLHQQAAER
jgi:transposase